MIRATKALALSLGLATAFSVSSVSAQDSASPVSGRDTRPNILFVMVDDAGFMDFGAYGGDASTPTIDALADEGAMFSRFYATPQCGPSRAMAMTGRDNHEVGMGSITEALAPEMRGHPGYSMRWPDDTPTIASRLRDAGYQTFVSGKWGIGDIGENLPNRFGFDRSYVMDSTGGSNFDHQPYLPLYDTVKWYEDGERITLPDDFYSSVGIVDKMITYLDEADPNKPFFGYLAFQAIHFPIQVAPEYRDRYEGQFQQGWDAMRAERLERAVSMGLVPENTALAPMPAAARDWDSLSANDQVYWARAMQVNAGMLEAADEQLGRLLDHLDAMGQLDNTLVIVTSDNGPESAGIGHDAGPKGIFQRQWMKSANWTQDFETLGERGSMAFIGREWASVSAAPFALFKFTSGEGGMRVPLVISGPDVDSIDVVDGRAHMFDLVPTMLHAAGQPTKGDDLHGRSLWPMIDGSDEQVYSDDEPVGFEVGGNAALYRGDWKITRVTAPNGDGQWRLYDLANDAGETTDLAAAHPALFQQMLNDYLAYSKKVGVVQADKDFSPFTQVDKNVAPIILGKIWPFLMGVLIAFIAAIWLLIRGLRRLIRGRVHA